MSVAELAFRAVYLGLQTLAPSLVSPEPASRTTLQTVSAVAALVLPTGLALWLRRAAQTLESAFALAAWPLATVMLFVAAGSHTGADAPLLRGYYMAAPLVWVALAITAAAAAGHFLGSNWKNKRIGAAVIVLAVGIFVFRDAHELIASRSSMWAATLVRQPGSEDAFAASFAGPKIDRDEETKAVDLCLKARPDACVCLVARSDLRLRRRNFEGAAVDAKNAFAARCAVDRPAAGVTLREVLATSLAKRNEWDAAEALLVDAPANQRSSRFLVARALVRQARGDLAAAEASAREALQVPDAALSERDATLLIASLEMQRGEKIEARKLLDDLIRRDPQDGDAIYDLALLDDLASSYNAAREGYLRALRANPELRAARHNLVVLTMRQGIVTEARHHALKFAETWPDDPRSAELIKLTGALPGAN